MSVYDSALGAFMQMQAELGTTVSVRHILGSNYNVQSDLSVVSNTVTVVAVLEPISQANMEIGKTGIHIEGDFIAYLPQDTTVDVGDQIIANSMTYRVNSINQGSVGGVVYQECVIKRVEDPTI